jgi:hypothetical protein
MIAFVSEAARSSTSLRRNRDGAANSRPRQCFATIWIVRAGLGA